MRKRITALIIWASMFPPIRLSAQGMVSPQKVRKMMSKPVITHLRQMKKIIFDGTLKFKDAKLNKAVSIIADTHLYFNTSCTSAYEWSARELATW